MLSSTTTGSSLRMRGTTRLRRGTKKLWSLSWISGRATYRRWRTCNKHTHVLQHSRLLLRCNIQHPSASFQLGPVSHLAGPSFSLADVAVFPTVATLFRFGSVWHFRYRESKLETYWSLLVVILCSNVSYVLLRRLPAERYPCLGKYYALLKERPSIKASWPPHWLENPKGQDTLKDIWDSRRVSALCSY